MDGVTDADGAGEADDGLVGRTAGDVLSGHGAYRSTRLISNLRS
jgi:hypothetical protein